MRSSHSLLQKRPRQIAAAGVALALLVVVFAPPGLLNRTTWMLVAAAGLLLLATGLTVGDRPVTPPVAPPRLLLAAGGLWFLSLLLSAALGDAATLLGLGLHAAWLVFLWLGWWLAGEPATLVPATRAGGIGIGVVGGIAVGQAAGIELWPRTDVFPDRVVSVFTNPNHLGSLCAFGLPLLTAAFLRDGRVGRWLVCASAFAGLLLSGSRGAWIATLAGLSPLLAGFALTRPSSTPDTRRALILLATWAVTTLVVLDIPVLRRPAGPLSIGERMVETGEVMHATWRSRDTTLQHRIFLWSAALEIASRAPLLGMGPGGFASSYQRLLPELRRHPRFERLATTQRAHRPHHAHNEALHTLAESGVLGLAGLAACLLICLGHGALAWHRCPREPGFAGALGACLAVIVHGLVSYPLYMPATSIPFFLLLGILCRTSSLQWDPAAGNTS